MLNLWIEYGLRDLPTTIYPKSPYSDSSQTAVTLKTTKHQEVFTFLRPKFDSLGSDGAQVANIRTHPEMNALNPYQFYRPEPASAFRNLPYLRPSVLYIFGGQSQMSASEFRKLKLEMTGIGIGGSGGAKEGRVKEIVFGDVGHLVPMCAVNGCAQAAVEWLAPEMRRWREQEAEFQQDWERIEKKEKVVVCEEWKKQVGGDPKLKSSKL